MLRNVPVTLWVWFVVTVAGDIANVAFRVRLAKAEYDSLLTHELFLRGTILTEMVLLSAVVFELARRLDGRARTAARIAGWIFAAMFASAVVQFAVDRLYSQKVYAVLDYVWRVESLALYGAFAALLVAARAWARAPLAMAAVIVLALLRNWVPYVTTALHEAIRDAPLGAYVYPALGIAWTLAFGWLLVTLARDARVPSPDGERARSGFRLAASALWVRIAAAGFVALVTLTMATGAGSGGGGKGVAFLVLFVGPAVVVATAAAFMAGIVRAAESRIEGLSSLLLVAGAVPAVWMLAPHLQLVTSALGVLFELDLSAQREPVLVTASAIALAVGFVLVSIAIAACRAGTDPELRTAAASTTIAIVALQLLAIGVQHYGEPTTQSSALTLLLFVAAANIGTLVVLGRLLSRAAAAFASGVAVPTARVIEK